MNPSRAHDVAYVRFRVPDLQRMRVFLKDFGMSETAFADDRLYMAGEDGAPFIHMCELAEAPSFAGFGLAMQSGADLDRLAESEGLSPQPLDAPGGGRYIRLVDPDGFVVDAVAGQQPRAAAPLPDYHVWNQGGTYPRRSTLRRIARGPSHVRRLGHVVLGVSDFRQSEAWYKARFGFVTSDEIQAAPDMAVGAFLRCDRDDQTCDHHTLFLLQHPGPPGFMHAAYEVADLDDLMTGHDHLKRAGYDHLWGIGRHELGSQVFDYWRDPYGHEIEHWTDGDQLVTADGGSIASIEQLIGVQWGMDMPPPPAPSGGREPRG